MDDQPLRIPYPKHMDVFTYRNSNISMASSHYTLTKHCPSLFHSFKTCSKPNQKKTPECLLISRRCLTSISLGAAFLCKDFCSASSIASSVEIRWTVPQQSLEDAYSKIELHARNLLKVKASIDSKSWREAHITLKDTSPLLKQDLYTIIQNKPPKERGELRRLYTYLFNTVVTLDDAAEDKDENQAQECYDNIVTALDKIFVRI